LLNFFFLVVVGFENFHKEHPSAVATVLALTALMKESTEETLFGLSRELNFAVNQLKKSVSSIPVHSACDLFIHDVFRYWKQGDVVLIIILL
jgi:hypothetical protein